MIRISSRTLSLAIFLAAVCAAQNPPPYRPPEPPAIPNSGSPLDPKNRRTVAEGEGPEYRRAVYESRITETLIKPVYRNSTKSEMSLVEVDPKLVERYASVLNNGRSGIFKLVPDHGCDPDGAQVVSGSDECRKFTMPGAGNSYSFRFGDYRIRRLADISINGGAIFAPGVLMHGIIVDLGSVPIESITKTSGEISFLQNLKSAGDAAEADKLLEIYKAGVDRDGRRYASAVPLKLDSTYAVRAIAYDGKVMRTVRGIVYDELRYDKRRDLIVVFKVVEIGTDGSATIVWRELSSDRAPTLQ